MITFIISRSFLLKHNYKTAQIRNILQQKALERCYQTPVQFIYAIFGMKLERVVIYSCDKLPAFRYWDQHTLLIHSPEHIKKSPALKKE